MTIVPSFFTLTPKHITYPTALCTVHKMTRKSKGMTIFWTLVRLRTILFKKYSWKRLESILFTSPSEIL